MSTSTNPRITTTARVSVVAAGGPSLNPTGISIVLDKKLYGTIGAVSKISGTLLGGLTLKRASATDMTPKAQRTTWQTTPGTIRITISAKYAGVVLKYCTEQGPVKVEVHPDGTVLFAPINLNTFPERTPKHLMAPRAKSIPKVDKFKFKSTNGRADVTVLVLKEAIETVNRIAKETGATLTIEEGVIKARIEI